MGLENGWGGGDRSREVLMVLLMAFGLAAVTAVPWNLAGRFVGATIGTVVS